MSVDVDQGVGDNKARRRGPLARHRHRHAAQGVRDGRDRRPDRRRSAPTSTGSSGWRATRSPRSTCTSPAPTRRRCAPCSRARRPRAGDRRRRAAGLPAAPRHAADRDGRRLHADPGRGHRDARRPRRLRGRGRRRSPRPRCAASSTSRSRCGRGWRCWPACSTRRSSTRCTTRSSLDARRPDAGADPAAARLPVRDRLRRLQPDHRPARRRPRHPLRPRPTSSRSSTAS